MRVSLCEDDVSLIENVHLPSIRTWWIDAIRNNCLVARVDNFLKCVFHRKKFSWIFFWVLFAIIFIKNYIVRFVSKFISWPLVGILCVTTRPNVHTTFRSNVSLTTASCALNCREPSMWEQAGSKYKYNVRKSKSNAKREPMPHSSKGSSQEMNDEATSYS